MMGFAPRPDRKRSFAEWRISMSHTEAQRHGGDRLNCGRESSDRQLLHRCAVRLSSVPPCLCAIFLSIPLVCISRPARADVTAAQVNAAIESGIAYLEKQQRPEGRWGEYESEPGGATALATLALLNCGRTTQDESVKKALAYLERLPDSDHTYSASLMIMAFAQADAKKYALTIKRLSVALAARQMRDGPNKGGW